MLFRRTSVEDVTRTSALIAIGLATGLVAGVGVTTAQPFAVTILAILGLAWGLLALVTGRYRELAFIDVAVLALVVTDVSESYGLRILVMAVIAAHVLLLPVIAPRIRFVAADIGVILLALTAMLPAMIAGDVVAVIGNGVATLGVYAAVRLAQPDQRLVLWTLLGIGTIHALAALIRNIPELSTVLWDPFFARLPYPGTRSTGLLDNPNQLGLLEAGVIVFAFWNGLTRRTVPFVVLCGVALLMSGSREAVLGLALGLLPIFVRRPLFAIVAGLVIVGIFAWYVNVFPATLERFDPSRYANDPSFQARLESWDQALRFIARSPFGYGSKFGFIVDQAYLGWLLAGGVFALAFGVAAIAILMLTIRPWPVLVVLVFAGFLAASFSGSPLALLLIVAGALPRWREESPSPKRPERVRRLVRSAPLPGRS
jgi:hypothetical protein